MRGHRISPIENSLIRRMSRSTFLRRSKLHFRRRDGCASPRVSSKRWRRSPGGRWRAADEIGGPGPRAEMGHGGHPIMSVLVRLDAPEDVCIGLALPLWYSSQSAT